MSLVDDLAQATATQNGKTGNWTFTFPNGDTWGIEAADEQSARDALTPVLQAEETPPKKDDLAVRLLAKLEELNVIPKGAVTPDQAATAEAAEIEVKGA